MVPKLMYPALKLSFALLCTFSLTSTVRAQVINTVAGTGTASFSGDGGAATAATLNAPNALVADGAGNYYISDAYNHRVRKVSASGIITTFAGNGTSGYSGDGGAATAAKLNQPTCLAIDGSGNIYISDIYSNVIRKVNTSGIITTYAGSGSAGFSGDGGPATAARFNYPYGIAFDGSGNMYVADEYNHRIRKINTSGTITTICGSSSGYSGDGGAASAAQLFYPNFVITDAAGNIYITDNTNHRVRQINTSGVINTIVGNGTAGFSGDGGPATAAKINFGGGMRFDGAGNLYFADLLNNRIRIINTSGIINTFAGTGAASTSGDGGMATAAGINGPLDVAFDASGYFLIAETDGDRVRGVGVHFVNHPTNFLSRTIESFTVCENDTNVPINTQLSITDSNTAQTETWSVYVAPAHGTLNGFSTTATSTGGTVTPSGLSYTPTPGYTGTDGYKIIVTDGTTSDTASVVVTINPAPNAGMITGLDSICIGDTFSVTSSATGGTWFSSNGTATIAATGLITGHSAGTDTIRYIVTNSCGTDTAILRLKIRSHAACTEAANLLSAPNKTGLTIYPNPTDGTFIVNLSGYSQKEATLTVANTLGQKVKEQLISSDKANEVGLDVPAGVYFVSAVLDGVLVIGKVVVE